MRNLIKKLIPTIVISYIRNFIDYISMLIGYFPNHYIRLQFYKLVLKMEIGKDSSFHRITEIRGGSNIVIGNNVVIGERNLLDGRKGLIVGDNVNISSNVSIYSEQHDYNDPYFGCNGAKVIIEKNVWIGPNVTILSGVTIAEGSVIGAGSLVTQTTKPYFLYGGVPAKKLKERNRDIRYKLKFHKAFF